MDDRCKTLEIFFFEVSNVLVDSGDLGQFVSEGRALVQVRIDANDIMPRCLQQRRHYRSDISAMPRD